MNKSDLMFRVYGARAKVCLFASKVFRGTSMILITSSSGFVYAAGKLTDRAKVLIDKMRQLDVA